MKNEVLTRAQPLINVNPDDKDWLSWQKHSKEKLADCKVFSVNKVVATSKCAEKKTGHFYTLDCGAWVNVIAITDDDHVVMVEQYRHGVENLTLEIPGGSVDDTDADPLEAAVRELREETGFVSESWAFLGKTHPNPALQGNLCYTYLARGVRQIESPKFDGTGTEKINTRMVRLSEINSLIGKGQISHALVIVAFHFLNVQESTI
ncbi:MAG: NUDIX hydrolase [Candidatus Obscuribacterales bacterium]